MIQSLKYLSDDKGCYVLAVFTGKKYYYKCRDRRSKILARNKATQDNDRYILNIKNKERLWQENY